MQTRDYFAGLAMQALLSSWEGDLDTKNQHTIAALAWNMADVMWNEHDSWMDRLPKLYDDEDEIGATE